MILSRVVIISKRGGIQELARQVAAELFAADNLEEAFDIINRVDPDMILTEPRSDDVSIRELLNTTDNNSINVPIVLVGSEQDSDEYVSDFINMGAHDYLRGPRDYKRLRQIAAELKNATTPASSEDFAKRFFADSDIAAVAMVGRSKAIRDTVKMIKLIAASRCCPILIVGETGTGKELAAKAIHNLRHPKGRFVAVNCAALTANLLESELFGHVKGAFTGADCEKTGLLELAANGTIFLDEISEMPVDLQAKLLRVVQEKTFRKVGGINLISCSATIMASTNRDLRTEIEKNRFRQDLYYRLNVCPVTIAPLNCPERREDIPLLAEYFLKTSTICPEKINKIVALTSLSMEALQKHHWPGNVRELRNVIERAILLETTDKVGMSSIMIDPAEPSQNPHDALLRHHEKINDFSLAKAERELIARALQETGWQKTRAAGLLGITRATLYAKVKQYHIEKGLYVQKDAWSHAAQPAIPQPAAIP